MIRPNQCDPLFMCPKHSVPITGRPFGGAVTFEQQQLLIIGEFAVARRSRSLILYAVRLRDVTKIQKFRKNQVSLVEH